MKRFITIVLSLLMITGFAFSSGATETESELKSENITYADINVTEFPGYVHRVNYNCIIKYERDAAAARDVLRYSAKLDDLDEYQKITADVNFDGEVTAADARILLRYCARLGGFPVTLRVGQELKFGPFNGWWKLVSLTESSDNLKIEREIIPMPENPAPGDSAKHILHVTPSEPGTYTFEAVYIGYTDEVEESVRFDITCIE